MLVVILIFIGIKWLKIIALLRNAPANCSSQKQGYRKGLLGNWDFKAYYLQYHFRASVRLAYLCNVNSLQLVYEFSFSVNKISCLSWTSVLMPCKYDCHWNSPESQARVFNIICHLRIFGWNCWGLDLKLSTCRVFAKLLNFYPHWKWPCNVLLIFLLWFFSWVVFPQTIQRCHGLLHVP